MIRFANAPCSWGTIEGWGQDVGYAQMLDELKSIGYNGAVLEKLKELQYDGWVTVEQDVLLGMGEPRQSARRNREYITALEARLETNVSGGNA